MIAPSPTRSMIHLVAPPPGCADPISRIGRATPTILLSHALKTNPTLARAPIVTIGPVSSVHSARAMGIDPALHAVPPSGIPKRCARKILGRIPRPETVVCWSDELLELAHALSDRVELVSTSPTPTRRSRKPESVRVLTQHDHDVWSDHKSDPTIDEPERMIPDTIPPSSESVERARRALGIEDHQICLGALSDNPCNVKARDIAFLFGLFAVSGFDIVGIVPRSASKLDQAVRHHAALHKPFRFVQSSLPFTDLLPALDGVVTPPPSETGSSLVLGTILDHARIPTLRLGALGKGGFTRSQRVAARLMDQMISIRESKPTHAR